jgi:hypothetical protein
VSGDVVGASPIWHCGVGVRGRGGAGLRAPRWRAQLLAYGGAHAPGRRYEPGGAGLLFAPASGRSVNSQITTTSASAGTSSDPPVMPPPPPPASQRGPPQFPGVWGALWSPPTPPPPPVRKCHQMSSKDHIQDPSNSAGSSVGSVVLSNPPGHPAAGRACVRVVPVLPLLLCTRPARSRPSIGVKAPLPLRASSRGVLPGAGALEYGKQGGEKTKQKTWAQFFRKKNKESEPVVFLLYT